MVKNFNAMKAVVLTVKVPQVQTELSDLIFKFEGMQKLGCPMVDYEKFFFKEELIAIAFWYAEKARNTEGSISITNNDLFTEFETIN